MFERDVSSRLHDPFHRIGLVRGGYAAEGFMGDGVGEWLVRVNGHRRRQLLPDKVRLAPPPPPPGRWGPRGRGPRPPLWGFWGGWVLPPRPAGCHPSCGG